MGNASQWVRTYHKPYKNKNPNYVIGKQQKQNKTENPVYKALETTVMSQNGVCREACLKHDSSMMPRPSDDVAVWRYDLSKDSLRAGDKHSTEKNRKMSSGLSSGSSFANQGGQYSLRISSARAQYFKSIFPYSC